MLIIAFLNAFLATLAFALSSRRGWLRLDPGVVPPERSAPVLGLAFFVILLAQYVGYALIATVMSPAGSSVETSPALRELALPMLGGYAMQVPFAIALALLLARVRGAPPARRFVSGGVAIVLVWPVLQTAFTVASSIQRALTQQAPPPVSHTTLVAIVKDIDDPWAVVIVVLVVVVAPFVEEVSYRGALQGCLRALRVPAWLAIGVVSAIFAIMHLPALPPSGLAGALAQLLVLSVGLGVLRERTRSLTACVVAHGLFNAINIVLATLLK